VSHRFRVLGCALAAATVLAAYSSPEQETSGDGPTVITYWSSLRGTQAALIPLVVAFLMLQRYWRSGLTAGSVK
jgi:ABC-type glycerol-3-phosphate transport system permease component